jgi:hypothetical protein
MGGFAMKMAGLVEFCGFGVGFVFLSIQFGGLM